MKKILLVDDSKTARMLFRAIVEPKIDCEITDAVDLDTALSAAQSVRPNICILDYNFPKNTGIDIAKKIIEAGIKTKFVLMTANIQESILKEIELLKFVAVIEKPLDEEKLINLIREL